MHRVFLAGLILLVSTTAYADEFVPIVQDSAGGVWTAIDGKAENVT